jgi:basic membrane lipoprotein Med (substrate-binding protein (PBP1-ABC) superfamily)
MNYSMRIVACAIAALLCGVGCGKDQKSSAERDAEVQKALQEGAAKERKMYEGMQKGVQDLEKKSPEEKEKK